MVSGFLQSHELACPGLSGFLSGFGREKESNQRKREALREGKHHDPITMSGFLDSFVASDKNDAVPEWWYLGPSDREQPSSHEVKQTVSRTHKCPAPGCEADVPQSQLACRGHWFSLPKDIRDRVWSGYRNGGGEPHAQAIRDAIEFLNAKATAWRSQRH